MGVIDKYKFESRGGHGCSNSNYVLHRTTCCRRFCVEDSELADLYVDPTDLTRRMPLWRGGEDEFPCPFCGTLVWDLSEVDELDEVPSDWHWACVER